MLVYRCHQLLSGFPINCYLPRVERQSANDKGDIIVKPELCIDVPGNPQIGDRLLKVVRLLGASNGVPCLKMMLVGLHSTSERKERTGSALILLSMEPWAVAKKLYAPVEVPPAPVRVSSQRSLAPSVTEVMSRLFLYHQKLLSKE